MIVERPASLGMYDLPGLRQANDALWRGLAAWLHDHGVEQVPWLLDRRRQLGDIWDDPDLLLAQTCGFPLATRWRGRLRLVATPCYDAPGCDGPDYRSVIVVSHDSHIDDVRDLRGATVAVNEPASNSGCNLLAAALAPWTNAAPFFAGAIVSGSHLASAEAVANRDADVAALDVVTYAHLQRLMPDLTGRLRVVGHTPSSPGLPFVTAGKATDLEVDLLRRALQWAVAAPDLHQARETLLLKGIARVPLARYQALATLTDADGVSLPRSLVAD
jgi:ABC-type phosphate/phosphonate transport system substrate-binding protein